MSDLRADRGEIAKFVDALFPYAPEGTYASLRTFDQVDRTVPPILIRGVKLNGAGAGALIDAAVRAAQDAADAVAPAVFAPPIATFTNKERARAVDLAAGLVLSIELDENPSAGLARIEALIGSPTVVVESGSFWTDPEAEAGEPQPKLHAHWRLSEAATDAAALGQLREARTLATLLSDADPTAAPIAHPLRWPGSWNRKAAPRLATIVAHRPEAEIHLPAALEILRDAVEAAGLAEAGGGRTAPPGEPQADPRLVAAWLSAVPNGGADVHYAKWVTVGYAVWRAVGGDAGFALWDAWSRKSEKYVAELTALTWQRICAACAGANPPKPIGAGTLAYMAKGAGWRWTPEAVRWKEEWARGQEGEGGPKGDAPPGDTPSDVPPPGTGGATAKDGVDGDGWPEPLDFLADGELTGAPELRPEHLPPAIAPYVFDSAARMGTDPAAVALSALTALASVIDDGWEIQPKRLDDTWTEAPRIWGAIVGVPSMLKSPIIRDATAPIDRMEAAARERHADAMGAHRCAVKAWKEAGSDPANEPRAPRLDRYIVEGTTTEALTEALRDDGKATQRAPARKILIRQDEMSEWIAGFDRYRSGGRGGADRGAYLRLYNGGRFTFDRVIRGTFAIPNWSACILGGIQPGPIRQIAKDATDDGLLQRFCYCVPAGQGRGEDRPADTAGLARYGALFPALAALHPAATARPVVLHDEAHAHRLAMLDLGEAMSAIPDASDRLKAALGKLPGLWARLVLTFHLIGVADADARGGGPRPAVAHVALPVAIAATRYLRDILLPHLLRADAVMFATDQTGHARWIGGLILSRGEARIAARDIIRAYRPLRAPEQRPELLAVMHAMEAMGWVRAEPSRDGRPVTAWHVNPRVLSGFAERGRRERENREAAKVRIRETLAKQAKGDGP